MGERVLRLGSVELIAGDEWCDTTSQVEAAQPPLTLTRDDGCGALQLTIALYRAGAIPRPSPTMLLDMARQFGTHHDLVGRSNEVTESLVGLAVGAASYKGGKDFIRVWYVSDGLNIAMVTYTCAWGKQDAELHACESMVRTLRFRS